MRKNFSESGFFQLVTPKNFRSFEVCSRSWTVILWHFTSSTASYVRSQFVTSCAFISSKLFNPCSLQLAICRYCLHGALLPTLGWLWWSSGPAGLDIAHHWGMMQINQITQGELNHRHTLQGFISSEDASPFSRLNQIKGHATSQLSAWKKSSQSWFDCWMVCPIHRHMRSSNLLAARNTTPLCYPPSDPSEAPQDASHVPDSFWRFAKDQGITGRRRGAAKGQGGIWPSKKLIPKDGCLENESIVTKFVVPLVSQFWAIETWIK